MENSFYRLVEQIKTEAENALSRLSFLEHAVFWVFMPLKINVDTDKGVASLVILKDGTIQLREYLSPDADNTIQADFETLTGLYQSRDKNQFIQAETEGRIKIISHSRKGQQAEGKLRELLSS